MAKQTEKTDLSANLSALEKKYGSGFLKKANKFPVVRDFTSTGSITLDKAIGIGGIPKEGRITQIVGLNGASKTTLSAHIIINEQRKGNECAFLDIEGALDINYIESLGVDLDMLYLVDPVKLKLKNPTISGEDWLMICGDLVESNRFGIIVLDSVAALTPNAELQEDWSNTLGKLSRMLSQGFRMITSKLLRSDCGLILLNQYRVNIGGYGNPYIEAGGESLKYYTSVKIELSKSLDKDATSKEVYGSIVKAKVTKNKLNPPYGVGEYYLPLGMAIDEQYEVINLALDSDVITKTGNTYSYGTDKLGVGMKQLKQSLIDNPDLYERVRIEAVEKGKVVIDAKQESILETIELLAEQI